MGMPPRGPTTVAQSSNAGYYSSPGRPPMSAPVSQQQQHPSQGQLPQNQMTTQGYPAPRVSCKLFIALSKVKTSL